MDMDWRRQAKRKIMIFTLQISFKFIKNPYNLLESQKERPAHENIYTNNFIA
jgi:hypothetical protein